MGSNIEDEDLYRYAGRLEGQVVIITGGASGIGKATALELAKRRAKVVIGDINMKASEELVNIIRQSGGTATWKTCNVLEYDDQRSLFEFALEEYGTIDVVFANAGIGESGLFKQDEQGLPTKPNLKTIEINYISVIYTAQLAYHYFDKASTERSLKTLVITASILSFTNYALAPLYCTSKHAVFSLAQSLKPEFEAKAFRIASIHPWFTETPLVRGSTMNLLYGLPFTPVERVAGAVVLAITDESPDSNGAVYTTPDEREVFRMLSAEINEGAYSLLSNRTKRPTRPFQSVINLYALTRYCTDGRVSQVVACAAIGLSLLSLSPRLLCYVAKAST